MGLESKYSSERRTPVGQPERHGRLAVQTLQRFEQLEVVPSGVSRFDADSRAMCQRPFCGQTECPVASVFQLEARPNSDCHGCSSTGLVAREKLCISPVLSDNAIISEVEGTRGGVDSSHSFVANASLVPQLVGSVSIPTSSSPFESNSVIRPTGGDTPLDCEPDPSISRLACIKRSLQSEGIRADASKLILAAWRPGTNAVYNSAWKKWHSWCLGREIDPFRPSLADITSFLAHSFNQGLEYRTLNTYRSALSGVLPPIDGFPVGQHPIVIRLLKGVLNLRPALPRYQQYWSVDTVLTYLRSLPRNEDLSMKLLTQKLTILLALIAPKRSSELKLLDLRYMRILPEGVEFKLPGLTKTSSEVTSVFFGKYADCDNLCVLRCLQCYLTRTIAFRPVMNPHTPSQLLISFHRPHRPVKPCSIARWIRCILSSAGIDTAIFKGHSTRSASTSKARTGGVSLEEVIKMADWSGTSTFTRFYYRPTFDNVYARTVMSIST